MRRVIDVVFDLAGRAVIEVGTTLGRSPAGNRALAVVIRGDSGSLVYPPADVSRSEDQWRMPGALHVHRFGRPVPVELVLARWSEARSELRLELRCRRGRLRIPPHYFDVADAVMDELRDAVERAVEEFAPGTRARGAHDRSYGNVVWLADVRDRRSR